MTSVWARPRAARAGTGLAPGPGPESPGQPGLAAAARRGGGGHRRGRVRRLRPGAAGGAGQPPGRDRARGRAVAGRAVAARGHRAVAQPPGRGPPGAGRDGRHYYGLAHFIVTPLVLAWLWLRGRLRSGRCARRWCWPPPRRTWCSGPGRSPRPGSPCRAWPTSWSATASSARATRTVLTAWSTCTPRCPACTWPGPPGAPSRSSPPPAAGGGTWPGSTPRPPPSWCSPRPTTSCSTPPPAWPSPPWDCSPPAPPPGRMPPSPRRAAPRRRPPRPPRAPARQPATGGR